MQDKITDYIPNFNNEIADSQEITKTLLESIHRWLDVFKLMILSSLSPRKHASLP